MGALTCYCFLFVFVQRLVAGETGNPSAQALYFMQDNTHLKLCHHLSYTDVRLIERPIFFLLVLKGMDKICTGSTVLLQTWMEFISPVVALENIPVAHLYLNQQQGSFCGRRRPPSWKSLYRGVSYVVHIYRYCGEGSRSSQWITRGFMCSNTDVEMLLAMLT